MRVVLKCLARSSRQGRQVEITANVDLKLSALLALRYARGNIGHAGKIILPVVLFTPVGSPVDRTIFSQEQFKMLSPQGVKVVS